MQRYTAHQRGTCYSVCFTCVLQGAYTYRV